MSLVSSHQHAKEMEHDESVEKGTTGRNLAVLFFAKRVSGGGAERIVTTLLRGINRTKFDVHLATLGIEAYKEDIPEDVVIHRIAGSELRWSLHRISSLVRNLRPDIILSTMVEMNVAVLLAKPFFPAGTKVIVREASNPSHLLNQMLPYPFAWKQAYRLLYPRADAMICQSRSMEADVLKTVPISRQKLFRIYNGVDLPLIEQRANGPSPFGAGHPNLLAVGRLSNEKNFGMLLEAFEIVRRKYPTARLTMLGIGPEQLSLRQKARDTNIEDSVDFKGFEQNPFPYYRHADLYLQTSIFEGLSNVLLEISSLGTPSVATLAGGSTDEIAEIAGTIQVVREPGAAAFASMVLQTLQKPRPTLNREEFLNTFGVDSMLRGYENVLTTVARSTENLPRSSGRYR